MVFYRKYRPQTISDLDSELVRNQLTAILSSKEIPHAFLLSGPKGLGKTSAARIIAKAMNCTNKKGVEPCNSCESCVSITNGLSLDVLEIDAASNRGIDEIRDLRDRIKLATTGGNKKIYIIDEVHMLTTEAFNALLKTLEEPPSHVVFVLCTTDLHKVPETIRSRCFQISFRKADKKELSRSLNRIAQDQKISLDDETLTSIVKAAGGSFRDGAKILELAVLQGGKKITQETIANITGGSLDNSEFIEILVKKDVKKALSWLNTEIENGLNVKLWIEDILATLHNILLGYYDIKKDDLLVLKELTEEDTKRLIKLFATAHQQTRTAVLPQLPAELAIIEYCTVS